MYGADFGSPKGRTKLEKILLGLLFLNIGAIIVVGIVLGTNETSTDCNINPIVAAVNALGGVTHSPGTTNQPSGDAPEVCTTPECVTAASNLILSLDTSTPPCEDFYKFACGGWMTKHEIPEAKSRYGTFTEMRDEVDFTLKALLQAPVTQEDKDYTVKAKNMFASCMDIEQITSLSTQPVKQLITDLGGWPLVTSKWNGSTFNLQNVLLQVNKYNLLPVIEVYVGGDVDDPTKTALKLDQPGFGLPGQKYYLGGSNHDKVIKAYKDVIYGVAELIGLANGATAHNDVDDIVEFETKLANISDPDEARRNPYSLNNPMTLKELDGNYSTQSFNMSKYVTDMMGLPDIGFTDIKGSDVIINMAPNYFKHLKPLLENTSAKTIANYIVWRSIFDNMGALDLKFRKKFQDFRQVVYGMKSDTPRGDLCVTYINRNLGFAAGNLFLRAAFANDSKAIAENMIDNIRDAFNAHLKELNWMDPQTKQFAEDKNMAMTRKIGYGPNQFNNTYQSEYYSEATVNSNTFFNNVLSCKHRAFVAAASGYRQLINKTIWSEPPQTVNAYYNPSANQITFPAGILQPPFFNSGFPKYLNYGAMGSVIGHEITHGFDDQGRRFDKEGRLKNWWTNETSAQFISRTRCIVDQYAAFYHKAKDGKEYHVNGVTNLGENLADNGGIKLSYQAYRTWASSQSKPEPKLPGLDYTVNQMFFINFAQAHCGLSRDEQIVQQILTDPHSPSQFRAKGSLQNMAEFSEAFKCKPGSPMNPVKKCLVW